MLGCTVGNGHPYSWSAIINGYDRDRMTRECPFQGIPTYLNRQPEERFGFEGVQVTHVCCTGNGGFSADHVADCARIPYVVTSPFEVIGKVDAVVVATDIGGEHLERARPFVEAGLPVFIDKPLADNSEDLRTFVEWVNAGRAILSSSCMRYAKEFLPFRASTRNLGELRFASITVPKTWEAYAIHALEAIYPILGGGFLTAWNTGSGDRNIVHFEHASGADVIVANCSDMSGGFGCLQLCGTEGQAQAVFSDTFYAFREQLADFVGYLRTGQRPFPFRETEELISMVIAGDRSRRIAGRVRIADVLNVA